MGDGPPRGNLDFVSEGAAPKAWVCLHAAGFRVRGLGAVSDGAPHGALMFVDRCATRRPVMHLSHATPVLLRPGAWASRGRNPSGQRHVRSGACHPEPPGSPIPVCSRTSNATQARHGLFQPEEDHFLHEPRGQLASPPPEGTYPASPGDAHPVYPTTERQGM